MNEQAVYNTFKFLHVAAVIVWIGGLVAIGILNARLAREGDGSVMAALGRASAFFGGAVVGPSAALTLVAGIAMVATARISFATLWIAWGLGAIFVSVLLGATLVRRAAEELDRATQEDQPDQTRIVALRQRLRTLSIMNLLLLFSVVGAMVFKPTL